MRTRECQFLHPTNADKYLFSDQVFVESLHLQNELAVGRAYPNPNHHAIMERHTRQNSGFFQCDEAQHVFVFLEYFEDFACGF